ncbi:MAG: sigma-70 family RNA polymerase sigma factor [Chlorobi bacterium]|nr:sigma-70 family RNA polymerase sigma factor [Chlorobiota bacterium]
MEINRNFSDKAIRDFHLIKKAKKGDEHAFAELLGYYRESLFRLLLKMVNSKEDAEDLMIETFEKAFRKISSYKTEYAFSTWLFRIATNHGIDYLRTAQNKYDNVYIDKVFDYDNDFQKSFIIKEESLNPEESIVSVQEKKIIKDVVQKLPPDYRRIVILRYFEDYSYNEIAEKLDLPIGTVKARLFRSRELLQSILAKHNIKYGKS